jgi:rod shape-determining protein MreD
MNNVVFLNSVRFVVLVLAQAFIFNNIDLWGYINPYIYVLFILLYPISKNETLLLFLAFFLGLSIDFFSDSGGIHAASSLVIAYFRPWVLKFSFGVSYEYNTIKVSHTNFGRRLTYISILVTLHHLVLFSLESFNIQHTLFVLKSALFSSIFTIFLCLIFMVLFSRKAS